MCRPECRRQTTACAFGRQCFTTNPVSHRARLVTQLGYSRIKINRVLGQARTAGILEIQIKVPTGWHVELETDLIRVFGLRDAVVVTAEQSGRSLESVLGEGAAGLLTEQLQPGMRIGLGIGRTMAHLPERFRPERHIDCSFIELIGAAYNQDWARFDVTSKMAELAGGTRESLQVPGFLTDPDLSTRLALEPSIADTRSCPRFRHDAPERRAGRYQRHFVSVRRADRGGSRRPAGAGCCRRCPRLLLRHRGEPRRVSERFEPDRNQARAICADSLECSGCRRPGEAPRHCRGSAGQATSTRWSPMTTPPSPCLTYAEGAIHDSDRQTGWDRDLLLHGSLGG